MTFINFRNINYFLLLLIIFIPNNLSYYFNGLPFLNKYETFLAIIILPFTFFFLKDFIFSKKIFFVSIIIILIKLIISFSPQSGVNVKQFFNKNDMLKNNFIKTYDTFWNKNVSAIQKFPWKSQNNFPLDWTHLSKINIKDKKNNIKYIDKHEDFLKLKLFYNFNFFIVSEKDQKFFIDFGNSGKVSKFEILKKDLNNNIFNKFAFYNSRPNEIYLKKGIYKFNINLEYLGNDWKFEPYYIGEEKKSLFEERLIFANLDHLENKIVPLKVKIFFSKIYDFLIIFLLTLVFFITILNKKIKFNVLFSFLFFITYLIFDNILDKIFQYLNIIEGVGSFSFGVYNFVILNILILIVFFKKNNFLDLDSLFKLISIPTCLYVFTNIFYFDFESFAWAGAGDDWTTFQEYSRQIVVESKWIEAGEKVFYFRPGSRYIYAISHILFGQSAFAFKILNVWCIILCSYLIIQILNKFGCNKFLSNIAAVTLLSIYTADNFRWILVVGLSEYYAMIFLFIAFYLILIKEKITPTLFIFICLCGVIQIWLREEHAPVTLSLIFLVKYKYLNQLNNFKIGNYFIFLFNFLLKNIKIVSLYFVIIISGFLSIFIRNYFVGNNIGIFDITAVNTLLKSEPIYITYFHTFSRLIFGVDQYYPTIPKLYSLFNVAAIIISFKVIFDYKKYNQINFALPIILFATIFPYFFVENIAYTPRYVIHLLPTSIIICFMYLSLKLKKYEKNINYRI